MKDSIIHIGVWTGLIIIRLIGISNDNDLVNNLMISVVLYSNLALIFYLSSYLFRIWFERRKYLLFVFSVILLFVAGTLLFRSSFLLLKHYTDATLPAGVISVGFIRVILAMILGFLFQLINTKKKIEKQKNEIQLEKNYAEMQFLKNQLNPHFFFNTLNNIYGLAFQKSDLAPQLILKLSEIMRYIIYETREDFCSVHQELKFLNNYVELEKLRLTENYEVQFHTDVKMVSAKIAPLIFLSFVENCFKHVQPDSDNNAMIQINIWDENHQIFFSCKNTFSGEISQSGNGVGHLNVKKRLDLLYHENYELEQQTEGNDYYIFLKLPLK